MDNESILTAEMEALKKDIIDMYDKSGKRVSGQFERDLKTEYSFSDAIQKVDLFGNATLSGRKAGKMPPVENLKKWIEDKGIQLRNDLTSTSLAWAIAKSIAKNGTKTENHLNIYNQVITPQRIDSIIQKVSQFNADKFVSEIQIEMKLLTKTL